MMVGMTATAATAATRNEEDMYCYKLCNSEWKYIYST